MNIYEHCKEQVCSGVNYSIDYKTRTLKLNGKVLIDHGKYEGLLGFDKSDDLSYVIGVIEGLYGTYKHSIPSEKTESKRKVYFFALREEELDDDDMLYGRPRAEEMFDLEYYVLAMILNGSLKWPEEWKGWFWQSKNDPDLVILRDWIVGE